MADLFVDKSQVFKTFVSTAVIELSKNMFAYTAIVFKIAYECLNVYAAYRK